MCCILDKQAIITVMSSRMNQYTDQHKTQLAKMFGIPEKKVGDLKSPCKGRKWETFDTSGNTRHITAHYMTILKKRNSTPYALRFEIRNKRNALLYHLVFISHDPDEMLQMKKSMWSVSQSSNEFALEFSDFQCARYAHLSGVRDDHGSDGSESDTASTTESSDEQCSDRYEQGGAVPESEEPPSLQYLGEENYDRDEKGSDGSESDTSSTAESSGEEISDRGKQGAAEPESVTPSNPESVDEENSDRVEQEAVSETNSPPSLESSGQQSSGETGFTVGRREEPDPVNDIFMHFNGLRVTVSEVELFVLNNPKLCVLKPSHLQAMINDGRIVRAYDSEHQHVELQLTYVTRPGDIDISESDLNTSTHDEVLEMMEKGQIKTPRKGTPKKAKLLQGPYILPTNNIDDIREWIITFKHEDTIGDIATQMGQLNIRDNN